MCRQLPYILNILRVKILLLSQISLFQIKFFVNSRHFKPYACLDKYFKVKFFSLGKISKNFHPRNIRLCSNVFCYTSTVYKVFLCSSY